MSRSYLVCLAFVTAVFAAPFALADESPADGVILASGERVACEILSVEEHTVRIRIGTETYELERATLSSIERAGKVQLDEAHLRFVRDLAPRLAHTDKRLAAAALAGLRALGDEGRPYLDAVAEESNDVRVKTALLAVHRVSAQGGTEAAPSPSAVLDAWIARAQTALPLESKQEPGFRTALEAFFQDGRSSGDWQGAWQRLRTSLEPLLSAEQMKKFEAMRGGDNGG